MITSKQLQTHIDYLAEVMQELGNTKQALEQLRDWCLYVEGRKNYEGRQE